MQDQSDGAPRAKAATPYLAFNAEGRPYLQGSKCRACAQVYLGQRDHCAKCAVRDSMTLVELSRRGRLYNYTIVHRSYPGVTVPFISAIVDLDGGGTVKGNLVDIDANPDHIQFDMPVEVVFHGAERASPAGAGFLSHFFTPAKEPDVQ
jgi:uncharacterized OB-fold protein